MIIVLDTGRSLGSGGNFGVGGWTPIPANVVDGDRVVQQVVDWIGGTGTKPDVGQYVGATGLVTDIADAVNLKGDTGAGLPGIDGWTPLTAIVEDGARRVHRVVDWFGGEGQKPDIGMYVGPNGFVALPGQATDIRGPSAVDTPDFLRDKLEELDGEERLPVESVKDAAKLQSSTTATVIKDKGVDYALRPHAPIGAGRNYLIFPGVKIVNMNNIAATDFAAGGATALKVMDPSARWFPETTQLLDVTNQSGAGAGLNLTRTLPAAIAALGSPPTMCVPIWVEDYTKINTIEFRFSMGDGTFANYFKATWGVSPNGNDSLKRNGWQFAFFGPSDWVVGAGTPTWDMTINSLRYFQLNSSGVVAPNGSRIKYDSMVINYRAQATLCFMIDGTDETLFNFIRPLCNSLGIKITCSLTPRELDTPGKLTTPQAQQMVREGHVFVPRQKVAVGQSGATTPAQVSALLKESQDYIREIFPEHAESWVRFWVCANGINEFVQGDRSLVDYLVIHNGIVMARTTDQTNGPMMVPQGYGQDNLWCVPLIGGWQQSNATYTATVDKACDRMAMVIDFTHGVTHETTVMTLREADFRLKYWKTKINLGLAISKTLPEWYDGL